MEPTFQNNLGSLEDMIERVRAFWGNEEFYGIPLGSLLTCPIIFAFRGRYLEKQSRFNYSDILLRIYRRYLFDLRLSLMRRNNSELNFDLLRSKHLLFVPSFLPQHLSLLDPIARNIGLSNTLFVSGLREDIPKLPDGFNQINLFQLTYDRKKYSSLMKKSFSQIKRRIRELAIKECWGSKAIWILEDDIASAINMALRWDEIFKRLAPKSLLVTWDYFPSAYVGVHRARFHGIPSLTLQHGIIGIPAGFTPLVADKVAVWGNETKEFFLSRGTLPNRVLVGGCPRLSPSLYNPNSLDDKAKSIGWPQGRRDGFIVLTHRTGDDADYQWVKNLKQGLSRIQDRPILIKCHPAEPSQPYFNIFSDMPNVFIAPGDEWSLDEALTLGIAATTLNSGAGLDALYKGKYLVIFNPFKQDMDVFNYVINYGAAHYAETIDELINFINLISYDNNFIASINENIKIWTHSFCAYSGDESGKIIADFLYDLSTPCPI